MIRFDGRVAIVTGGGRGLGRAYALDLARRGARVVVNDVGFHTVAADSGSSHSVAEEVVAEIKAMGGEAVANSADVSKPDAAEGLAETALERFGRLDIVVNNAGNQRFLHFAETTREDFDSLIDIHLGGSFNVTRAAWPHMVKAGYGRVIFTTSQVGFYGQVDAVAYGAAKSGIIGLMHGIKLDAARDGILVNCISPFAQTRMTFDLFPKEVGALIAPADVAAGVSFLASEECKLNGEILISGGGHYAIAKTIETEGIDLDDPAEINADTIAARIGEITDTDKFFIYPDALTAVQKTFDRLNARLAKA